MCTSTTGWTWSLGRHLTGDTGNSRIRLVHHSTGGVGNYRIFSCRNTCHRGACQFILQDCYFHRRILRFQSYMHKLYRRIFHTRTPKVNIGRLPCITTATDFNVSHSCRTWKCSWIYLSWWRKVPHRCTLSWCKTSSANPTMTAFSRWNSFSSSFAFGHDVRTAATISQKSQSAINSGVKREQKVKEMSSTFPLTRVVMFVLLLWLVYPFRPTNAAPTTGGAFYCCGMQQFESRQISEATTQRVAGEC